MESWITWIIQVVAYGIICFLLKRELNQFDQRDKRLQERIDEVEKKAATDTKALAEKIRALGNYGSDYKYHHVYKGQNSRLDELQAAFLAAKLPHLDAMNAERRRIAARYLAEMHNPAVTLPAELPDCTHVWHIFAVRCADRDALEKHLNARGIGTNKHYPTPIHLQGAYAELGLGRGALPLAEEISATELSLPMFYGMTDAQVQAVIDAVNEFEG